MTELVKMNQSEIEKLINSTGRRKEKEEKPKTPAPLKKVICNCSVCHKKHTCVSYNGCHVSTHYSKETGEIIDRFYGCIPGSKDVSLFLHLEETKAIS